MSGHAAALGALGLEGAERAALVVYLDLVARWNPHVNLTAARTDAARAEQLVAPVLGARPHLKGPDLLDVGSGNGSPGLVLSVLHPFARVTLLEPRAKRWAFLKEAARSLGLQHVTVVKARHDEASLPAASTVTVRAVALGPAELGSLVAPGGRLLIWRADAERPDWRTAGRWSGGVALERST